MFYYNGSILTACLLLKTLLLHICFTIRSFYFRRDIVIPVPAARKILIERQSFNKGILNG